MIPIKKYFADLMMGRTYHFKCDCVMNLDVTGRIVDYELQGSEIIFLISVDNKIIKIGSNHPNLMIEPVV